MRRRTCNYHLELLIDALDAFTETGKVVQRELVRQESRDERTEHMLAVLAESLKECEGE